MVKMTKTNLATISLIAKEQHTIINYLGSYHFEDGDMVHYFAIGSEWEYGRKEPSYSFNFVMEVREKDNKLEFYGLSGTNQLINAYEINQCQIIIMKMNSRLLRY